jgi:hypothetical protein
VPDDASPPTRAVRLAALVVGVEALGLLGVTVWIALTPVFRDVDTGLTELEAVLALLGAVLLGLLARGLARTRAWALTPSLLVAFFTGVVGVYQLRTLPALAVVLLAFAVAVVGLLLSPGGRAAFPPRG